MTDENWQRLIRLMDEAFGDYLTGMARLRERVVADLKRTLTDSKVLDRFDLEQSGPRGQPAAAARGRRVRGRRKRRS